MTVIPNHIEVKPGVCGGKPYLVGPQIKVQDVVICYERRGMSPEEIVYNHPNLTLADVHAALAYYYAHGEEIRRDIEQDETYTREIQAKTSSLFEPKLNKQDEKKRQFPSLNDFRNSIDLHGLPMSISIIQKREDEIY